MTAAPRGPILVYGAGAVGQFVGGTLSQAGHDVTLLVRPALRDVLARTPLTITAAHPAPGAPATVRVAVPAVATITELTSPPALVILTVKGYDTEGALPDLRQLVAGGAVVLTLQNGVGNEETLRDALGAPAVRSGAFTISVSTPEPGQVVRHTAKGGLGFAPIVHRGPAAAPPDEVAALLDLFQPTGLPLVTARSHRVLKWSKLLLNMLANAQSALLDLPPAALYTDSRLFAVERRAFQEARDVMRAAGIGLTDLPAYPVRALAIAMALPAPLGRRLLAARVGGGRGTKLPSLALDLHARRGKSEIAWYNGAVVALGERLGVPTPVNATLTRRLAAATVDPAAWTPYRGHAERLLTELG
jgi:2-dehydropantoate 2-reductase